MDPRLTLDHLKWLALSFLFVSFSIFFSYGIFPSQSSILAISFVVIGLTPPLYNLMSNEENVVAHEKKKFLEKYEGILINVLLMAVGIFLAFSLWYAVLPAEMNESIFSLQKAQAGERSLDEMLALVLFSFLLSLFLGAGAILIITWDISTLVVSSNIGPMALIGYLPELFAFFLTGLAGALLSFALVHHEWKSPGFFAVLRDSGILLGLSFVLIILSHFLL